MKFINFILSMVIGFIAVVCASILGIISMFTTTRTMVLTLGILTISTSLLSCNRKDSTIVQSQTSVSVTLPEDITETYTLVFGGGVDDPYTYVLDVTGNDVKITYTFDNHEPIIEYGKLVGNNIVVDGCTSCYEIADTSPCDECQVRWSLCVYNPETDRQDCYSYNDEGSNAIVFDIL